jgi:hypothetical protein
MEFNENTELKDLLKEIQRLNSEAAKKQADIRKQDEERKKQDEEKDKLINDLKAEATKKEAERKKDDEDKIKLINELKAEIELKSHIEVLPVVTIDKVKYQFQVAEPMINGTRTPAKELAKDEEYCRRLVEIKSGILLKIS